MYRDEVFSYSSDNASSYKNDRGVSGVKSFSDIEDDRGVSGYSRIQLD
jgi:hypothetical protein